MDFQKFRVVKTIDTDAYFREKVNLLLGSIKAFISGTFENSTFGNQLD